MRVDFLTLVFLSAGGISQIISSRRSIIIVRIVEIFASRCPVNGHNGFDIAPLKPSCLVHLANDRHAASQCIPVLSFYDDLVLRLKLCYHIFANLAPSFSRDVDVCRNSSSFWPIFGPASSFCCKRLRVRTNLLSNAVATAGGSLIPVVLCHGIVAKTRKSVFVRPSLLQICRLTASVIHSFIGWSCLARILRASPMVKSQSLSPR